MGASWDAAGSWSTAQATQTTPANPPTAADTAIFGNSAATVAQFVNLNGNQSITGISTNTDNKFTTTILGGSLGPQTLSIGSGGINHTIGGLTIGTTNPVEGLVAVSLTASQSWNSSAATTSPVAILVRNGVSVGTVGGSHTLTLTGLNTGSQIFGDISDGAGTLSILRSSATTTSVWTLSGNNTFSGGVTLTSAILRVASATALGTGTLTINGGTLDSSSTLTLTSNNAQTWNGNFTYSGASSSLNMGTGAVSLGGGAGTSRSVTVSNNGFTVGGVISDGTTGTGLTKLGIGTLILTGSNLFTGTTTISAGVLRIHDANGLGTVAGGTSVTAGGTLALQGGFAVTGEPLTLAGDGASTGGALRSISGDNTYSGPITLSASATTRIASDAGLFTIDGVITNNMTATQQLMLQGAGNGLISSVIGGPGRVTRDTGAGIWTLSGANTYIGQTAINASVLSVASLNSVVGGSASSNLGAPTTVADGTIDIGLTTVTGRLRYTGAGETTDRVVNLAGTTGGAILDQSGTGLLKFTGNLTATGVGIKLLTLQGDTAGTGEIAGNIVNGSGTVGLTKLGTGLWTLSGTGSSYTGATTISAGTLRAGAANTIPTTSALVMGTAAGTTFDLNNFNQSVGSIAGGNATGGTISLGSAALTVGSDNTSTIYTGAITGTGSVQKIGTGALTFGGASNGTNTYTGGLFIKSGMVTVGNVASALGGNGTGTVTLGDATLQANATLRLDTSLTTFTNPLQVANAGAATLTITNNAPAVGGKYSGAVTLAHDLLVQTVGTGSLTLTGGFAGAGNLLIDNSGTTSTTTLGTTLINHVGTITNAGVSTGLTTITAPIGANVTGIVQNSGASVLSLGGTNTAYTGTATVNAGKLLVTGASSLNANNVVSVGTGATFEINAALTIAGLNNIAGVGGTVTNTTVTPRTLTLGGSSNYVLGGPLTSTTPANLLLTVALTGTGSQTLGGDNTYAGATTVNRGTLALVRSGAVGSMGATAITVGSGATPIINSGNATLNIAGNYVIGTATGGSLTVRGGNTGATPLGQGTLSLFDSSVNTLTLANATAGNNLTLGATTTGNNSILNLDIGSASTDKIAVGQNLLVNLGGATINLNQLAGSPLAAGTYDLLTYTGRTLTGAVTLGSTPTQAPGTFASFTLSETGTAMQLTTSGVMATGTAAFWKGGLGSTWNTVSGGNSNFTSDLAGTTNTAPPGSNTDVTFVASGATNLTTTLGQDFTINSLTFNSNAGVATPVTIGGVDNTLTILATGGAGIIVDTGSGSHTINSKVALGAAQSWIITDAARTLTVGGAVSGNFGLTKGGAGTLILSGPNSYGATTITSGTLQIGSVGASGSLGTGPVTNNGTLTFSRTDTALIVPNVISGSGTLTKVEAGVVTLSGANTYTGLTTVSKGALNIQHNTGLGTIDAGTVVAAGGAIQLQGGVTITGETLSGTAVASTDAQPNALVNISGNNTWTGQITANGSGGNNFRIVSNGGLLTVSGNVVGSGTYTTTGTTGSGLVLGGSNDTTISGVVSGAMSLITTVGASGTVTLSGENTYTGITRLQSAGILSVDSFNSTGTGALASSSLGVPVAGQSTVFFGNPATGNSTSGILRYTGDGETTNRPLGLLGPSSGGTATLDQSGTGPLTITGGVNGASAVTRAFVLRGSTSAVGEISGVIGNTGTTNLSKSGTGTWILSGSNTYVGTTTVDGGTLLANNVAGSATGTGNATVNSGGTFGGIGSITGTLAINSGGAVAPGSGGVESLATGAETWGGGGIYRWEIGATSGTPGVDWDLLQITGLVTVTATNANKFIIDVDTVSPLAATSIPLDTWYTIAHADTLTVSDFTLDKFGFLDPGTGQTWDIRAVAAGGGGFDVQVSIPEPGTLSLAGIAAVGLLARRRRR